MMRKDEKVENAIGKIQKEFMRYTQLKIAGFKTLMAGPGDRDWANGEATSLKNKTSRFHNFDDLSPFGASRVAQAGEQSHKSKKKNRKSSGTLTGKFTDEKRSRNVGFESYVTEYNHKKTTTKALQGQQQSRYNSIDGKTLEGLGGLYEDPCDKGLWASSTKVCAPGDPRRPLSAVGPLQCGSDAILLCKYVGR